MKAFSKATGERNFTLFYFSNTSYYRHHILVKNRAGTEGLEALEFGNCFE
jgi:hypothetical protein